MTSYLCQGPSRGSGQGNETEKGQGLPQPRDASESTAFGVVRLDADQINQILPSITDRSFDTLQHLT